VAEPEKAARRRSTVREKVSFAQPDPAPAVEAQAEPPAPAQAEQPAPDASDSQPRRAGWWSRRFGNGA
jgi:ribonuclease E